MSFRVRVTLLVAVAIAFTVAAASAAVWFVARHELFDQLDKTVYAQAQQGPSGFFGHGRTNTEIITSAGDRTGADIPVTKRALAVASGSTPTYYFDSVTIQGRRWREYVEQVQPGTAVMSVQPLWPTEHALRRMRLWILLIGGVGIAVAAGLAAAVATEALRPIRRLTQAAETVAATGNLGEIGRAHV